MEFYKSYVHLNNCKLSNSAFYWKSKRKRIQTSLVIQLLRKSSTVWQLEFRNCFVVHAKVSQLVLLLLWVKISLNKKKKLRLPLTKTKTKINSKKKNGIFIGVVEYLIASHMRNRLRTHCIFFYLASSTNIL